MVKLRLFSYKHNIYMREMATNNTNKKLNL